MVRRRDLSAAGMWQLHSRNRDAALFLIETRSAMLLPQNVTKTKLMGDLLCGEGRGVRGRAAPVVILPEFGFGVFASI